MRRSFVLFTAVFLVGIGFTIAGCQNSGDSQAGDADSAKVHKEDADEHAGHEASEHKEHAATESATTKPAAEITQKKCPVMGEDIDPEIFIEYKGRKIYFCCKPCIKKFEAEPAKYLAKLDGEQ